jgi:acetylornithine deacetylase/succinyl-diaminopimelate desuccinylase-like protein
VGLAREKMDSLIEKQRSEFLADYKKIVEIPSVSAFSKHKPDIELTAKTAIQYLKKAGAEIATITKTKGNPVVFGRFENKKGAPTVAVYNHLDVQPATKGKDGWTREPFKFTEENGRFYSRGTTDDKGPAMTALWAARLAHDSKLGINIEFIWELEEEIGSPNFEEFVKKQKSQIKADSILVSDTLWLSSTIPSITRGLRGLQSFIVTLRTGKKDVHSGTTGGAARNPLAELAEIVSKTVDAKTGEILIPGFEKTWKRAAPALLHECAKSGFSAERFKKANELLSLRTRTDEETLEKIWLAPTFEVHGLAGGYQDEGVKTVVPPSGELKVSFRLVPGQDPDEISTMFTDHVKRINPDCEVIRRGTLRPFASSANGAQNKAISDALEFGFGAKPVPVYEGGSIGAVVTMNDILKRPILFMGLSLPEDGYHGPDESFAWKQVHGGVKAFLKYFELLSA